MVRPRTLALLVVATALAPQQAAAAGTGGVSASQLETLGAPAPAPGAHRFPVAGPFSWPGTAGRFGAGRAGHLHQGVDLFAAEGTPVVAPRRGVVTTVDSQPSGAGNYVVVRVARERRDYVFMHLQDGSTRVREGRRVRTGATIAAVGQTGRASGTHLHFEIWAGPWQAGGSPIDPLPLLRSWAT
jgi:murein DD-endopeptidase MepM/ murein hydrolase activator NlpD